jgi:rod shape-determining protein MreD
MSALEYLDTGRLFRTVLMVVMGLLAISIETAPLGLGAGARPSPDLVLCVVAYWAIRRPGSTPMLAVFALGLVRDLVTDVPPGAGTLTLVLAAEALKAWRRSLARYSFATEWVVVAGVALATVAMQWLMVLLMLAQPAFLGQLFYQVVYTAMAYPLVAVIFRWVLRISWRKAEPA